MRESEIVLSWQLTDGSEAAAIFDIVTEETHELVNTIPEHEVEAGANVADHVRVELDKFSVSGYVSNAPLLTNPGIAGDWPGIPPLSGSFRQLQLQIPPPPFKPGLSAALAAGVSALGDAVFGAAAQPSLVTFRFDSYQDRVRACTAVLDEARRRAAPVRVTTRVRDYDGMQFGTITITRSPEDGSGATFNVSLTELRTVSSDLVASPKPAETTGKPKVSAGNKHAESDGELTKAQRESLLHKMLQPGGLTALFGGATVAP